MHFDIHLSPLLPYLDKRTQLTQLPSVSSNYTIYIQSMGLDDTLIEPLQTQADDDNSLFIIHTTDWLSMQVTFIELLTSCAIAHYVNSIVERDTMKLYL